jgi:hypothetical protein
LKLADLLGLRVELIQDGKPNFRHYEKRGNGHQYFGKIVHNLYETKLKMKEADCGKNLANMVLHRVFGILSSKNKKYSKPGEVIDLSDEKYAITEIQWNGVERRVKYVEKGKYFKYSFCRIGSFLCSMGRLKMGELIYPIRDKVFRVHTDSCLYDACIELPKSIVIGTGLGEWKLEHFQEKVVIKKGRKPVWG